MKFKIDANLERVARWCSSYRIEDLSTELCEALEKAGIITDKPENIGKTLYEAKETVQVSAIMDIIERFSSYMRYSPVTVIKNDPTIWDAINNLVLIDWSACPYCGEPELEYYEMEGHELNDGDYYTPNSWVIDFYVYNCPECGKTIKMSEEL